MSPAVELKNISKWFSKPVYPFPVWRKKKKIQALTQVDLKIAPGSIFALVGPNGSGKTTLLKILAGLFLPDAGEVWIRGQAALASATGRDFYWRLTVRQNLEFFAALYDLPPKEIRQNVFQVAGQLGLGEFLDRPYEQLSSGTRQKLILARTLLSRASILLLDEPTRGLDPLAARAFRNLLKEFSRQFKKTLLLTTHNLAEAEEVADHIGVLHEGRLLKVGTLQEFIGGNGNVGLEDAFESLCRKRKQGSVVEC